MEVSIRSLDQLSLAERIKYSKNGEMLAMYEIPTEGLAALSWAVVYITQCGCLGPSHVA